MKDREGRIPLYCLKRSNLDISNYTFRSRVVDSSNDLPDAVVLSAVKAFKGSLDKNMRESMEQL
jgi:hypothetical protein